MEELRIHPSDNVVVSLSEDSNRLQGHKYAILPIKKGDPIIKYGEMIGTATTDIQCGEHVHTHNVQTTLGEDAIYTYQPFINSYDIPQKERTVNVYSRISGEYGIRNELWIIPTVGCVNGIAQKIVDAFNKILAQNPLINTYNNFDGIFTFSHPYGCSQMGDDHINTRETLQNIAKHPNAGGVLILGLGCENNQISTFMDTLGAYDSNRIKTLVCQESEDEIEEGCQILTQLLNQMLEDKREQQPLSVLNIGLECGGSDGLSGITANPLVGRFSDYLIHFGGTTVLTEVPEMFGAERQLMNRCIDESIYHKTVSMIENFKAYYRNHNQVVYDNPSPGNKKGGITTLEDKSLGCTTKSGQSPVVDVLKSTERLMNKGLNLISAPGNDAVATTILGMSGCQLVLFTTGRGTPFGGFIPTLKIATNSPLALKKPNWIDFNAGQLIEGTAMDLLLEDLIDLIILTVNGQKTKQEINNYRDIAIFKSGVTL